MAGATLEINYNSGELDRAAHLLRRLSETTKDLRPLFTDIGEYLVRSVDDRFDAQKAPDGTAWKPLRPKTLARKRIKKILTESSNLRSRVVYRAKARQVEIGTNVIYGAIHQIGGTITIPARSQQVYRHYNARTAQVSNKFVKRSRSNFAEWVTIPEHQVTIPARPFLGLSSTDETEIAEIIFGHLHRALDTSHP